MRRYEPHGSLLTARSNASRCGFSGPLAHDSQVVSVWADNSQVPIANRSRARQETPPLAEWVAIRKTGLLGGLAGAPGRRPRGFLGH